MIYNDKVPDATLLVPVRVFLKTIVLWPPAAARQHCSAVDMLTRALNPVARTVHKY